MNKIKNKMRPSYGIKGTLSLHSFITFEMALTVFYELLETLDEFERDCITMPVDKGYLLFSKYHLISKKTFSEKDYLLQNACLYLKEYRSKKIWEDTLDAYKREREGIRLFEISNGQVIEKDSSNLPYPERKEDYLQFIKSYQIKKQASRATQGNYEYIDHSFDDRLIHFYLDENIDKKITQKQKSINTRELITISLEELIQTAEEMKVINPEDHCVSILKKNLIKVVNGSQVNPADQIVIDKVVNIVGMVGSGKTTLLKVLTFLLEKRDKRVVIVTDTVAEVFNLFRYFSVLGSNCSPLIGKSERIRYINQLIREDEMYLDEILSQYLTTNCLIDGQAVEYEEATFWGNEPCTKIKQENVRYVCPYFNRCPSTLMRRRATESPIVITTVAGMTMAKTGELQDIFLKEIVESADVVFYDECDRIQRMLDNLFMPVTSFNDYVNKSAAGNFRYMKSSNAFRLSNLEESYYNELQSKTPTALVCVSRALQEVRKTEKKSNRGKSVSAYTLLESIEDAITNKTYQEIYKLMDFYHDHAQGELWNIMLEACDSVKNTHFIRLLTDWLKQHEPGLMLKEDNLDQERIEIQKKIVLILTLIRFDHLISEIEDAYDSIEDRRKDYDELVGFLRKRFLEQQAYLPSAPTGNLFGIKETKDNDILLFRQYAYGRSLLTDLPFLRIDSEGNPLGPHVILLSGSSYAKGSYDYHVNAEINYIIEADQTIRDFIGRIRFVELGIQERVSGSPLEIREKILRDVVDKCLTTIFSELEKDGKVLLVVNSYEQAEVVASHLRMAFKKHGRLEQVCALIADKNLEKGDSEHYLRRGEVYRFSQIKARILVAPANAIERGHNIIDEKGHTALSSIFLLVRPMTDPENLEAKNIKLNGFIGAFLSEYQEENIFIKSQAVRKEATRFWSRINEASKKRLDYLKDEEIKTDIIATLFVLILQIFGRLCRVTDASKEPPTVYFADGAFRKPLNSAEGFDVLDAFYEYLEDMMTDPGTEEIAKTLYEPFFNAYKGGIQYAAK